MRLRPLGRTGIAVSPIGYGGTGVNVIGAGPLRDLLTAGFDAGMNVIDTAECYSRSEELLGEALAGLRPRVVLMTKCGHASGLPYPDWDPRLVEPSLTRSLQRLRTDHVDVLQIHTCPLAVLQAGAFIAAVQRMKQQGWCRAIGFSGDRAELAWAIDSGLFDTVQLSMSVADQASVDLVARAQARGIGVITKRSLANAVWASATPPTKEAHRLYWDRLQHLAYPELMGPQAGAVALRFTLSVPGVSTALVHASSPARMRQNCSAASADALPHEGYTAMRARWQARAGADWLADT